MPKPLVVSIPHHLGKEEALRRLQSGLGSVRTSYGHLVRLFRRKPGPAIVCNSASARSGRR